MPPAQRLAGLLVAVLLGGCGVASGSDRFTLKILAASSLTEAFSELGTAYHEGHKNVGVRLKFAGSQEGAEEVDDHEPADVLVTADGPTMDKVAGKVSGRRAFAYNSLTIAVAAGNPRGIRGLADLADPRLRVVYGGPTVPVGRYARQVLAKSGVVFRPRSEEADARSVLSRVRTGEADAGLVYVTDVHAAGVAAGGVPIPQQQNVTATYHAAAVNRSDRDDEAQAFVTWLGSDQARTILRKYGFATP